jgi:hypothetical protein
MPAFEVWFMNDDYYKQQAARVRNIASLADPFTKKRLLALAEQYDGAKPSPRRSAQVKYTADNEDGNSRPTQPQSSSVMSSILISQEILSDRAMSGNAGAISPDRTNQANKT